MPKKREDDFEEFEGDPYEDFEDPYEDMDYFLDEFPELDYLDDILDYDDGDMYEPE